MTFFLVDVWQIRVDLAQTLSPCFDVFDVLGELLFSWESADDLFLGAVRQFAVDAGERCVTRGNGFDVLAEPLCSW